MLSTTTPPSPSLPPSLTSLPCLLGFGQLLSFFFSFINSIKFAAREYFCYWNVFHSREINLKWLIVRQLWRRSLPQGCHDSQKLWRIMIQFSMNTFLTGKCYITDWLWGEDGQTYSIAGVLFVTFINKSFHTYITLDDILSQVFLESNMSI